MSEWRNDFHTIYKITKRYCHIADDSIANELNVSIDSVRQYLSKRKTIPDNINALCALFEKEINNLSDISKQTLLDDIRKEVAHISPNIKSSEIGAYICGMLRKCYCNEKNHTKYKGEPANSYESTGHIQAIVFDFDGTLTKTKSHTTWEALWKLLGYDVKECQLLHSKYEKKEFSHQEWCDKSAEKFIEKNLTHQQVISLSKKIQLINGCKKTLETLKNRNIKMYIVSGSIKDIIENVLGVNYSYFTEIKANELVFDTQTSSLKKIIGTKYDFEGKANYVKYIANRLEISTADILFIGNSNNDIWVHQSGANTLCINPMHTNYHDNMVWHNTIVNCKDLSEILDFVT